MGYKSTNKNDLKKIYKETPRPMGVFQIRNSVTERIYLGSSLNITGKINSHRFLLKNGLSVILELQNDWNQYGEENFTFEILDYLKPKEEPDYDYTDDLKVLKELWSTKLISEKKDVVLIKY
jgi:hypothetical protein